MLKQSLLVSALALGACGSAPSAPSGSAPASAAIEAATYVSETEVVLETDADDNEVKGLLKDCLVVKPAPGGAVEYVFQLHFDYDHECSLGGIAKPVGPGKWMDESQENCRLALSFDNGTWSIDDPDSTCRETFCGARGSIGQSFGASDRGQIDKCGY